MLIFELNYTICILKFIEVEREYRFWCDSRMFEHYQFLRHELEILQLNSTDFSALILRFKQKSKCWLTKISLNLCTFYVDTYHFIRR